jgi:hypothetical protein
VNDLDGRWRLRRTGGLLPPLRLLHKRIAGGHGATHLTGALRLPFDVREREGDEGGPTAELVYPLGLVRDRLTPAGDGGWEGETRVLGVRVGRFRMRREDPRG